jgi:mannosyltransferase
MTSRDTADAATAASSGAARQGGITPAAAPAGHAAHSLRDWLVVIIPALAELLVGGYQIGRPSLWRDEGYTKEVVQRPIGGIIALLGHQDAVHGLYYVLMHPVVEVAGTSATALRLPSLVATSLAAALTAALGRRLAQAAGLSWAPVTGLLAGLLLVAVPLTTWYAQDARPYAMATLCAVGATYLLVRGMSSASRWWWAGYAAAIVVLALLNLTALLLLAAHGVSLYLLRGRRPAAAAAAEEAAPARPVRWRWLAASAAAIVVLSPLILLAASQSRQLGWVKAPHLSSLTTLVADFSGQRDLIPLVAALVLLGAAGDLGRRHPTARTPVAIALPWLILPPAVLLAVSVLKPVYVERYVIFCMPALALLVASGLTWLARLARLTALGGRPPALAVLPSALLAVVLVAVLAGPQQRIRTDAARTDDLARVTAVIAANERPGDAILYAPWDARVIGLAYPGPFTKLRDIGLGRSPIASATLTGQPASARVLARRFTQVQRLWSVRWSYIRRLPTRTAAQREQAKLIGAMVLVRRWLVKSVEISLYVRPASGA